MPLLAPEMPVSHRQHKLQALLQVLSSRGPRTAGSAAPRPVAVPPLGARAVTPPPMVAAPPVVAAAPVATPRAAPSLSPPVTAGSALTGDRHARLQQLLGQVIAFRRKHNR